MLLNGGVCECLRNELPQMQEPKRLGRKKFVSLASFPLGGAESWRTPLQAGGEAFGKKRDRHLEDSEPVPFFSGRIFWGGISHIRIAALRPLGIPFRRAEDGGQNFLIGRPHLHGLEEAIEAGLIG